MRAASFANFIIQEQIENIKRYSRDNNISELKLVEMFNSVSNKKGDIFINFEEKSM